MEDDEDARGKVLQYVASDPARLLEWHLGNALIGAFGSGVEDEKSKEPAIVDNGLVQDEIHAALVQQGVVMNTAQGTAGRIADWNKYLDYCHAKGMPLEWPPTEDTWLLFIMHLRNGRRATSYPRLKAVLGNVCNFGAHNYRAQMVDTPSLASVDPRSMYRDGHRRALSMMKRQHGMTVKQVPGITMEEARSGCNFVDRDSVLGCTMGLAWTMGCVLGGRRSRTLSSVCLGDILFEVQSAKIAGKMVKVAAIASVEFTDEKTSAYAGNRLAADVLDHKAFATVEAFRCHPSYWAYRLCVLRGAFSHLDPVTHLCVGTQFSVRPECCKHFLLCESRGENWVGAMPVAPSTLSAWNRIILKRMGCPPRGFSSHRRGVVTRALTLDLLSRERRGIDPGTIEAIARWGGWEAVTGCRTVYRIYTGKTLDLYLDGGAMGLGEASGAGHMDRLRARFMGKVLSPSTMAVERGRMRCPMRLRFMVWHDAEVVASRHAVCTAVEALMAAACANMAIVPITRFYSPRRLLNVSQKHMAHADLALVLKDAQARLQQSIGGAWDRVYKMLRAVGVQRRHLSPRRLQAIEEELLPVHIGGMWDAEASGSACLSTPCPLRA